MPVLSHVLVVPEILSGTQKWPTDINQMNTMNYYIILRDKCYEREILQHIAG